MTAKEFQEIVSSTEANNCQKSLNLSDQSTISFCNEIITHLYIFDFIDVYKSSLKDLKKWEVQNMYRKIFLADKKVLEVHIIPEKLKDQSVQNLRERNHYHIGDIKAYQKQSKSYIDGWRFR